MKKILYAVLGLFLLLGAAVFTIPLIIDANQYKPVIQAQFKAATGYEITMKGPVKLSLFPRPRLSVADVSVFNNSKNLANIEEISAYPKLKPLLSRKLEINDIAVQKPVLTLIRNENGDNWKAVPDKKIIVNPKLVLNIVSAKITGGRVDYSNKSKNEAYKISDINMDTLITSLDGPVSFDGAVKYNDLAINLKGRLENFDNPKLAVTATLLGSELSYDGVKGAGKFSIKSADITALAEAFGIVEIKQLAKLVIDVKGDIAYEDKKFDLENLDLTIGDTQGAGDFSLALDDKIEANADLKFTTINLDQLLPKNTAQTKTQEDEKNDDDSEQREIISDLDIVSDNIIYKGINLKNLDIKAETEDNTVNLEHLRVDFPTSGSTEISGKLHRDNTGRVFEGPLVSSSSKLRDILRELKVDTSNIKLEMLQNFKLDAQLVVNIRDIVSFELSDMNLDVDDESFSGKVSADLSETPAIDITGRMSGLDLDKYLIKKPTDAAPKTEKQRETGATDDKPYRIEWLEKLPFSGAVNIRLGKFIYDSEKYEKFSLLANFKPEVLNIKEFIAAGQKIQLSIKASIEAFAGKKPKINILEANLGKVNLNDFVKISEDKTPKAQDKSRWSKNIFDLSFLRKLDMDFDITHVQSLTHGDLVFDNLAVKGYIEKGQLVIEKSSSGFFDGKIAVQGHLLASAVPAFDIAYSASNAEIGKFINALTGNNRVSGRANFSGSFSSSGVYQQQIINNLSGTLAMASNNIVVRGFDLDGMAGQIINTNKIADVTKIAGTVSGEDAVTYLKAVNGGITIEKGQGRTQGQGIEMYAASGSGMYTGKANILDWTMDSYAKFKLSTPDNKTPMAVIHIFGAIDDPKKELNLDEVKRYISGRSAGLLLDDSVDPQTPATTPVDPSAVDPSAAQPLTPIQQRQEAIRQRKVIERARRAGWRPAVQK